MSDPTFITALRNDSRTVVPEAEGVIVDLDERQVRLTLDDGQTLTFDAGELRAALEEAA